MDSMNYKEFPTYPREIKLDKFGKPCYPKSTVDKITALYKTKGLGYRRLGKMFGINIYTVRSWILKYRGIIIKSPSRPYNRKTQSCVRERRINYFGKEAISTRRSLARYLKIANSMKP